MSEDKTQQLLYQAQMLETYFSDLTNKEHTLFNVLKEAKSAIESIMSLSEKLESNTLVPLGIGAYIKTKIISNENIILNIGAGVAIEKNKSNAINYIESRIKEIELAIKNTNMQKQDIAIKLEQTKQEINKLVNVNNKN